MFESEKFMFESHIWNMKAPAPHVSQSYMKIKVPDLNARFEYDHSHVKLM